MKGKLSPIALACAIALSYGCSDDDDDFIPAANDAQVRITHASPDAPRVNVYVDGARVLEAVDYKDSALLELPSGSYSVEVRGLLPDGSELSVIGPADIPLETDTRTDVVAYDTLLSGETINIKPFIAPAADISEPVAGVSVTAFHAAPAVADADVCVTGPDDAISSVTPVDLAFGEFAGPLALEAETPYRVRITPDGSDSVVYDSGPLSFADGAEVFLVAVENTNGIGDNPVNLLALNDGSADEVFDVTSGSNAAVRVVHNSADTPAVDVIVDGTTALSGLTFPNATAYDELLAPAGNYNVVVAATADNAIAPIDEDLTLDAATSYTVTAIGALNGISDNTLEPLLTVDDRRAVATEARLRVAHGAFAVASEIPVDVYLSSGVDISMVDPAISDLAYGENTEQLPVAPGAYVVTVTAAGDRNAVVYSSGVALDFDAAVNYTAIARDPASGEDLGTNAITLTLLTD